MFYSISGQKEEAGNQQISRKWAFAGFRFLKATSRRLPLHRHWFKRTVRSPQFDKPQLSELIADSHERSGYPPESF
jgi:hypothetical protein